MSTGETSRTGEVAGITDLVTILLEDRRRCDARQEEALAILNELAEKEATEHQTREMQEQMKSIDAYLTMFERMMHMYEVEEGKWAFTLAPQLSGKAQLA